MPPADFRSSHRSVSCRRRVFRSQDCLRPRRFSPPRTTTWLLAGVANPPPSRVVVVVVRAVAGALPHHHLYPTSGVVLDVVVVRGGDRRARWPARAVPMPRATRFSAPGERRSDASVGAAAFVLLAVVANGSRVQY